LRHEITFVRVLDSDESSQNSSGEDISPPETIGTFPCHVSFLQGKERENAMQLWAEAKYSILMRHQPEVTFTRKMRGTWNGRTLDILDVQDPGERAQSLTMIARDYDG